MASPELTPDELVFVERMALHIGRGLSFERAARAVLADDERLWKALCDRRTTYLVPTADERGKAYVPNVRSGDLIARRLAADVYARIRGFNQRP